MIPVCIPYISVFFPSFAVVGFPSKALFSFQAVMDFAENIVSNPVTIKLRREEESLGDELSKVVIFANSLVGLFCGRIGDKVVDLFGDLGYSNKTQLQTYCIVLDWKFQ